MSTITAVHLAAALNGIGYDDGISVAVEAQAKSSGLIIVFGASDDLLELRGAIHDEIGCHGTKTFKIGLHGVLKRWDEVDHDDEAECEAYFKTKGSATKQLTAVWCPKDLKCSWAYKLDAPHVTFDIMEDGELYCRGIVFSVADLAASTAPGDDAIATGGAS